MMKVTAGQVVRSKTGRDKGNYYLVFKVDEVLGFVWLVDGKKKTCSNPKRKNLKHIQLVNVVNPEFLAALKSNKIPDSQEIRKFLDSFRSKF